MNPSAGAPQEKRGNTTWVQCPGCSGWFHASPVLLGSGAKLHCPACHREFTSGQAARVVAPQ